MKGILFSLFTLFVILSVCGFFYLVAKRELSELQENNNHKQQDKKSSQISTTQSAMQSNSRNSQGSSDPTSSVDSSASKSSSSATSSASSKTSTSTAPHSNSHATASTTSQGTRASNPGASQAARTSSSAATQSPRTSETSSAQNARASGAPQAQNSSSASKQQQNPRTSSFQAPPPPPSNPANSATAKTSTSGMQGAYSFFLNPEAEQEVRPRRQTSQVDEVEAQRQERERAERRRREQEQQAALEAQRQARERAERERREQTKATSSHADQAQASFQDPHYDAKLELMVALAYISGVLLELGDSKDPEMLAAVLASHSNESVKNFTIAGNSDAKRLLVEAVNAKLATKLMGVAPESQEWQERVALLHSNRQYLNLGSTIDILCKMSCILVSDLPQEIQADAVDTMGKVIVLFLLGTGYPGFLIIIGVQAFFKAHGFDFDLESEESDEEKIAEACKQLGIARDISKEEFRRVKRNKLAQYHPDKAPSGQEEQYKQKFQEISALLDIVESQWK